jgi:lysophospholipase L1-like esterase
MEQIIAFGDSNTWGLNPVMRTRYPENVRWTGLLRKKLSRNGFELVEESLCGRTTAFDDPYRPGLKGEEAVSRILSRHSRSFAAIIMLGTNDCKAVFDATAEEIGKGLERCLDRFESEISPEHILVIAPAALGKDVWKPEKDPAFSRASVRVSAELKAVYSRIAQKRGHLFLAASDVVSPSSYDDEHLNAEGHGRLAEAIGRILMTGCSGNEIISLSSPQGSIAGLP